MHAINPRTGEYYKRPFTTLTTAEIDEINMWGEDMLTWNMVAQLPYLSTNSKIAINRFIKDGYGDYHICNFTLNTNEFAAHILEEHDTLIPAPNNLPRLPASIHQRKLLQQAHTP